MFNIKSLSKLRIKYFEDNIRNIKSKSPLYIRDMKDYKFDSIISVITTLYKVGSDRTNKTIDDKKQYTGRGRSITDLHRICKHYFPDVKIIDVMDAIHDENCYICDDDDDEKQFAYADFCGDIDRIVIGFCGTYCPEASLSNEDFLEYFEDDEMFNEEYSYHLCKELNL